MTSLRTDGTAYTGNYLELLSRRLRSVLDRDDCRLVEVVSADKLREMLDSGGASFTKNWYGQLMTLPQIYAYMLQIEYWLREYDAEIV